MNVNFAVFTQGFPLFCTVAALSVMSVRAESMSSTGSQVVPAKKIVKYVDGRPGANFRLEAKDQGVVLKHGDGPQQCDYIGARDVWVYKADATYYMHYDGAGVKGWLACLATSTDLVHWAKKGPALELGTPGQMDSASASYGTTFWDGSKWHMFYLGTPHTSPPPDRVPWFPYTTMKAQSASAAGPWIKQSGVTPFSPKKGTYYSDTASPGQIVRQGDEYLMFFAASTDKPILRTLGIARTKDLDGTWTVDAKPIVPAEEQVENSSLYFEPSNQTWFLFTNHIGIATYQELGLDEKNLPAELGNQTGASTVEYTDSIWVYWTKDLNRWNSENKAVVLDGKNCSWSTVCIGLPSVVKLGDRLAVFYDAPGGRSLSHMRRDVGLAWLDLPLNPPK